MQASHSNLIMYEYLKNQLNVPATEQGQGLPWRLTVMMQNDKFPWVYTFVVDDQLLHRAKVSAESLQ